MTSSRRAHLQLLGSSLLAGSLSACRKPQKEASQAAPAPSKTEASYRIGWCARPVWLPFQLMQSQGFLKKRAQEFGVQIELVEFAEYADCARSYQEGKLAGAALSTPQLIQCASAGKRTVAVLINAKPGDSHAIVVRQGDLGTIRGERIIVEPNSVSHYLLARALEHTKTGTNEIQLVKVPGQKQAQLYIHNAGAKAAAVWDPALGQILSSGKGRIAFSSKNTPNEILECLAISDQALKESPGLGKALCAAWFDALGMLVNPKSRPEALQLMSKSAGISVAELEVALQRLEFFHSVPELKAYLQSRALGAAMRKVATISHQYDLITTLNFGTTYGPNTPGELRFDGSYLPADLVLAR